MRKVRLERPLGPDPGVVLIVDAETEKPVLFVQDLEVRFSTEHLSTIKGTMYIESPDIGPEEEEVEIVRIDHLDPSLVAISE